MPSGATLAAFDALASRPPSTGYARLDLRNGRPVLDFGDSSIESTRFAGIAPSGYAGGGATARITFCLTDATSGKVLWGVALERNQPGAADLDADSFGPESSAAVDAAPTAGVTSQANVTLPAAALGGLAAGEPYRLRVRRLADNPSDTAAGDAELVGLELLEV